MIKLQERHKEWLQEREDRKGLEEKIKQLESKMVIGGGNKCKQVFSGTNQSENGNEDSRYHYNVSNNQQHSRL